MVVWQRHLQSIVRQVAKRVEHNCNAVAKFSTSGFESAASHGESLCLQKVWKQPSAPRPLYQYLQQMGISTSRKLQAGSTEEIPVSSPLSKPVLAIDSGETKSQKSKPEKVQAVLKKIKQSPRKVNLVAALVRGMRVEDALLQLQVTVKRAAKTVYKVIHSARANATHNHGMDPNRLLVAEAFLGKGKYLKRISYHSKERYGIRHVPECRLTVVLREMTPEEDTKIAKLKVHSFRKLSKSERRLVPHKLIETTPVWERRTKTRLSNEHNNNTSE